LFLLVGCANQIVDSDQELELRQIDHKDYGYQIRSVFAMVGFPAETGNRLVSACFCWGRGWQFPGPPRLCGARPFPSLVLLRPLLGRGVPAGAWAGGLPALRSAALMARREYTMVCNYKVGALIFALEGDFDGVFATYEC